MFRPPWVTSRRRSIHGTFDVAKERPSLSTRPVTAPPMHAVVVHLIMKCMIHLRQCTPRQSASCFMHTTLMVTAHVTIFNNFLFLFYRITYFMAATPYICKKNSARKWSGHMLILFINDYACDVMPDLTVHTTTNFVS